MAIGGSGEKRAVAGTVTVVGVGAIFEEPLNDFSVAAGDGAGEGIVAGSVGGRCINVSTVFAEVAGNVEMTEDGGESDDGKAIGRKGVGERRIIPDELFDAV